MHTSESGYTYATRSLSYHSIADDCEGGAEAASYDTGTGADTCTIGGPVPSVDRDRYHRWRQIVKSRRVKHNMQERRRSHRINLLIQELKEEVLSQLGMGILTPAMEDMLDSMDTKINVLEAAIILIRELKAKSSQVNVERTRGGRREKKRDKRERKRNERSIDKSA